MTVKWSKVVSVLAVVAGLLVAGGEAWADTIYPGHSYVESVRTGEDGH
ncbi:hypothetical protein [Amycolatopsis decaplanina]|nr:hypothetical protein [Amycolatopsis decaplanina]